MTAPDIAARLAAVTRWAVPPGYANSDRAYRPEDRGLAAIPMLREDDVLAALASEATDPAPPACVCGGVGSGCRCEADPAPPATSVGTDPAPEGDPLAEVERRIEAERWQFRRVTGAGAGDTICRVYDDCAAIVREVRRATDPGAGETVTEWGVRLDDYGSTDMYGSEAEARADVAAGNGLALVRVVVTEWPAEVSP